VDTLGGLSSSLLVHIRHKIGSSESLARPLWRAAICRKGGGAGLFHLGFRGTKLIVRALSLCLSRSHPFVQC